MGRGHSIPTLSFHVERGLNSFSLLSRDKMWKICKNASGNLAPYGEHCEESSVGKKCLVYINEVIREINISQGSSWSTDSKLGPFHEWFIY